MIEEYLPDGCPFVLGGGLIRDAIGGARPGDIDVWLPSNTSLQDYEEFIEVFSDCIPAAVSRCIFTGPNARGDRPMQFTAAQEQADYGDVNNHWVVETDIPGWPKINFMRSMTVWNNDSQAFFNGLMRAFDLDCCMFFIGYDRGQTDIRHVIMPSHLVPGLFRSNERSPLRMNVLHWNQYRFNETSARRVLARLDKINAKYQYNATIDNIVIMPTESIVAVPVTLKRIMLCVRAIYPMPQWEFRNEPPVENTNGNTGSVLPSA